MIWENRHAGRYNFGFTLETVSHCLSRMESRSTLNVNTVITVGDIMSPELVKASESMGIAPAIALMRLRGIRRLPVVNDENRLVAIVTVDDLLAVLAKALSGIADVVSREPKRKGCERRAQITDLAYCRIPRIR